MSDPLFHVVLHEPEIPGNTGNIGRTCAAVGAALHLIEPLGFKLEGRHLRRAGMDYWEKLAVTRHASYAAFEASLPAGATILAFSGGGKKTVWDAPFARGCYLLFGRESVGLPQEVLKKHEECYALPMVPGARSLNLSSAAAAVIYEGVRRLGLATNP